MCSAHLFHPEPNRPPPCRTGDSHLSPDSKTIKLDNLPEAPRGALARYDAEAIVAAVNFMVVGKKCYEKIVLFVGK